ncbi:MAG: hypothetical protein KF724_10790 [Phycisphaeraceae bacterium]|nr:hypothetical protein [Phycisphaeraceae bacterium]
MSTSLQTIAPAGRIESPLPCIGCGEVLSGLPIDGRCPKCGKAARLSIDAKILANPEYAVGGLQDLGMSLKIATLAPMGTLVWPVLGPLTAVVLLGATMVRLSAIGRVLRSGLGTRGPLVPVLRAAHTLAWISTIFGTIFTVACVQDAIGRFGIWLTPGQTLAGALIWCGLQIGELTVGSVLLLRAATLLDTPWLTTASRATIAVLAAATALLALIGLLLWMSTAAPHWVGIASQITLAIPIGIAGVIMGGLVQRLSVATEEMYLATSE